MGRHKYIQIIVMASKSLYPDYTEFSNLPDQEIFQKLFQDNENLFWYTNVEAFIEDLPNYNDLNCWHYRIIQVPQIVLSYLTGSPIDEDE